MSVHAHKRKLCQKEASNVKFFLSLDFEEVRGERLYYANNEAADVPWDSLLRVSTVVLVEIYEKQRVVFILILTPDSSHTDVRSSPSGIILYCFQ